MDIKKRTKHLKTLWIEFSPTSIKAVKEIYASKFQIAKHNVKALDFRKCLNALIELKK
mgnify:CR=1 FL=1